ncbi:HNH endonuclease signature motif containing protein [Mesorhizobium sp. A623]
MSAWPYNTGTWQALRRAKLSDQPLCEACLRREVVEPAIAVDHIEAIEKGGEPFPPLSDLMSMCLPCHNSKTNAVDHPNASGFRRALKGFDTEGNPIDPEGWDAPAGRCGPPAASSDTGAFAGPGSTGYGPAWESRKDLVSFLLNNEAENIKEIEQWV